MKKVVLLMMILAFAATMSAKTKKHQKQNYGITAPAFLKPGDKIAVISPGCTPKADALEKGCNILRSWGFEVVTGKHVLDTHHIWAGTIADRQADLLWALRDPSIKAIWCSRGGFGTDQLLDGLPIDTIRKYNKWVIGYSDITALHSAEICAGHMSIHGNMVAGDMSQLGGTDSMSVLMHNLILGNISKYEVKGHPYNVPGKAKGILIGGNLSVFTDLGGSKTWDFLDRDFVKGKDVILFFEDVEVDYEVTAQLFFQLKLKGIIDQVKGIILGHFYGNAPYKDEIPYKGYNCVSDMLHEFLQGYTNIPICYEFPTGHDESINVPLIDGCPVTLDVTKDKVTLEFNLPK